MTVHPVNAIRYICLLVCLLSACNNQQPAAENNSKPGSDSTQRAQKEIMVSKKQFTSSGMKLGKLSEHVFPQMVKVSGVLDVPPQAKNRVSALMGGYIKSIPLLEGNQVKKGQFLVSLENTEYVQLQQDYLEAKEQLSYLKSEYARQKTLAQENISSQKSFLKAESDYRTMLARYEGLLKKLRMLNLSPEQVNKGNIASTVSIYAPISGYITGVYVSRGMYVAPHDVILEIINTDHIHLELAVFEKDVMKVKEGQDITFRIPDSGSTSYEASVHLVGKAVEGNSRTVSVHGHLKDEENHGFVPGMYLEAQIVVASHKATGIPGTAVVTETDNSYLLVKQAEKNDTLHFKKVQVAVGQSDQDWEEITNGHQISPSDEILIKGSYDVAGEM